MSLILFLVVKLKHKLIFRSFSHRDSCNTSFLSPTSVTKAELEQLRPQALPSGSHSLSPWKVVYPAPVVVNMTNRGLASLLQEEELAGGSSEGSELWQDLEEGLREQAARLSSDLALSHQENRELQERLMVSEATVHAQAEQLKDYRDLLSESLYSNKDVSLQDLNSALVLIQDAGFQFCVFLNGLQQRHRCSRPANRCRWICRTWAMRRVGAARTKPREKTPAAQVTHRPEPSHITHCIYCMSFCCDYSCGF